MISYQNIRQTRSTAYSTESGVNGSYPISDKTTNALVFDSTFLQKWRYVGMPEENASPIVAEGSSASQPARQSRAVFAGTLHLKGGRTYCSPIWPMDRCFISRRVPPSADDFKGYREPVDKFRMTFFLSTFQTLILPARILATVRFSKSYDFIADIVFCKAISCNS